MKTSVYLVQQKLRNSECWESLYCDGSEQSAVSDVERLNGELDSSMYEYRFLKVDLYFSDVKFI